MNKKEVLRDPIEFAWLFSKANLQFPKQPRSVSESLLQALPNAEPIRSAEENYHLREVVVGALDILNEEERWIVNALLFERLSLRQAGYVLGIPKTTLARRRDKILEKLKQHLLKQTTIKEYLNE
jgi:RNA polymerase sigma factor (sigma-70 family)